MEKVYSSIDEIIGYAKYNLGLDPRNEDYIRNAIFSLFSLDTYVTKNDIILRFQNSIFKTIKLYKTMVY